MLSHPILWIQLGAALGSGLTAGVFFAFSVFVMRALADLPTGEGIRAMNAINSRAITPIFMILLFGTGGLSLVLAIASGWWYLHHHLSLRGETILLALATPLGAITYILGAIVVTMKRNVPLNRTLAKADEVAGPALWTRYLRDWTRHCLQTD